MSTSTSSVVAGAGGVAQGHDHADFHRAWNGDGDGRGCGVAFHLCRVVLTWVLVSVNWDARGVELWGLLREDDLTEKTVGGLFGRLPAYG